MIELKDRIITLRCVYGKGLDGKGIRYHIEPCRDPRGNWPACVRQVDSKGDIIMTKDDVVNGLNPDLIKVNQVFDITDGYRLDLTKPYDRNVWEAIKHSPLITIDRWQRAGNGELIINSSTAELFVEMAERDAERKVNKRELRNKAENYILQSSVSKLRDICKVLGSEMPEVSENEIKDYLLNISDKTPSKIISVFESEDTSYMLMYIDAKRRNVIKAKHGLFYYGEVLLGGSEAALIAYLKEPKNSAIYKAVVEETYPELTND